LIYGGRGEKETWKFQNDGIEPNCNRTNNNF
jgi:hypothetical protein